MQIAFHPLPSTDVAQIRSSHLDAYGQPVQTRVSDGVGIPCRHCLRTVPAGQRFLVLAHRPFSSVHAYAETGPIFLCEDDCQAAGPRGDLPEILAAPTYILRGYDAAEQIVYGTGQVVARDQIQDYAKTLLKRDDIAFVDVRSAANNCFQCRIRPASGPS